MAPTARAHRSNSPFCDEEETWIILDYGALRNALAVRRKFRPPTSRMRGTGHLKTLMCMWSVGSREVPR